MINQVVLSGEVDTSYFNLKRTQNNVIVLRFKLRQRSNSKPHREFYHYCTAYEKEAMYLNQLKNTGVLSVIVTGILFSRRLISKTGNNYTRAEIITRSILIDENDSVEQLINVYFTDPLEEESNEFNEDTGKEQHEQQT